MSTRRGQPERGSRKRKEQLLQIRVQADEKQSFEEAADLAGIAMSAWVRERLRNCARRELIDAGRKVPFLQPMAQNDGKD